MEDLKTLSTAQLSISPNKVAALVEEAQQSDHKMLIELIEDLDQRKEVMRKIEAIEDIMQASDDLKQERIELWADRLEKHPRTITRWLKKAEKEKLLRSLEPHVLMQVRAKVVNDGNTLQIIGLTLSSKPIKTALKLN